MQPTMQSLLHHFDAKMYLIHVVEPPVIANDSFLASVMITQAEILQEKSTLINQEMELLQKIHPVRMDAFVKEGFTIEVIKSLANNKCVLQKTM